MPDRKLFGLFSGAQLTIIALVAPVSETAAAMAMKLARRGYRPHPGRATRPRRLNAARPSAYAMGLTGHDQGGRQALSRAKPLLRCLRMARRASVASLLQIASKIAACSR